MQSHGTTIDDARIPENKPMQVKDGASMCFGADTKKYVLRCEVTGAARCVLPPGQLLHAQRGVPHSLQKQTLEGAFGRWKWNREVPYQC